MSGHSKWATIKHQKGAKDKARGKLFAKIIRQVEVAAREGGGDPESNPTLRTMFQKARDASVPMDTIERAIKRGTGELEGVTYESITYEGYAARRRRRARRGAHRQPQPHRRRGPRALHQARRLDGRAGRGGVAVRAQGLDRSSTGAADEDELMLVALDAGAEDLADEGEAWRVTTPPTDLHRCATAIEEAGIAVDRADLTMVPTSTDRRSTRSRRPRRCCALDRRARRPRRRAERLRQLRHPRRRPRGGRGLRWPSTRRASPAPALAPCPAPTASDDGPPRATRSRSTGAAGGARLLPGRQHAGLHAPAQRVHDGHRRVRRRRAPRCWRVSPQSVESHDGFSCTQGGFAFPLLADEDKAVGEAYGISARSASTAGRSSWSTRDGVVRYAHRAVGRGLDVPARPSELRSSHASRPRPTGQAACPAGHV